MSAITPAQELGEETPYNSQLSQRKIRRNACSGLKALRASREVTLIWCLTGNGAGDEGFLIARLFAAAKSSDETKLILGTSGMPSEGEGSPAELVPNQ